MENKLKHPIHKGYLVFTVIFFIAAFAFVYLSSRSKADQSGQISSYKKITRYSEDNLSLVRKEKDKIIYLNICNDAFINFKKKATAPQLLIYAVDLKAPNDIGLPSKTENETLYAYEDALRGYANKLAQTYYVATSTGGSQRRFFIYTSNSNLVEQGAAQLKDKLTDYEVRNETSPDKDWKKYDELCGDEK